ncbi:TetR family transcriptional regulator [Aeromicrobium sp. IC_218]|uniref:TetR family transcriptional regulator n=1 Tax=Aeromicrobium sp. IC_218 TaxID=2545468 RepID=UPI00103AF761|nr:TetR family transcriptional regulator [Aeromicrobium sp. IC_218]TCI98734.1 TetR family transcriptional regulator [Aeromicrobium sp. IC_218]
MEQQPGQTLRERTREAVRAEVRRAALALFVERGFDETRTEDIAAAAGISPRSFFRYFATKEDVLVSGSIAFGAHVRAALEQRPADEDLWTSLRRCLDPVLDVMDADPGYSLAMMRVIMSAPSLRAAHFEKHLAWEEMLRPVVAGRNGGDDLRASVLTHAAMAALDSALFEWVRQDGATPLGQLADVVFETQAGMRTV